MHSKKQKFLDDVVESLYDMGFAIAYVIAHYKPKSAYFSTRMSHGATHWSDKLLLKSIEVASGAIQPNMVDVGLPQAISDRDRRRNDIIGLMKKEFDEIGTVMLCCIADEDEADRRPTGFVIYNLAPQNEADVPLQHAVCDMVRELTILWSNDNHTDQLMWKEPKPKKKPVKK